MAEFLEDPSVLTKDRLKSELAANSVPLPSGEHKKEVYVQLYLKNLTARNSKKNPPADAFSSDEDLPAPVVSSKSRSGRKATKKTDKPRAEEEEGEEEVMELTDEDLRQQLAKYGVDPGPIVASTRRLYEKKLQKLLQPPPEAEPPAEVTVLPKADSNQNGNTNSDQYSDKEDEDVAAAATAADDAEPVPVVERSVRSRGKPPVTARTSSRRQTKYLVEETSKKASDGVVEDILANEISTPTGISASCRRPIRGAAGRPLKPTEYWLNESNVHRTVLTESRSYSESLSRGGGAVSSKKAPAQRGLRSLLLKLLLLAAVAVSLYYAYQNLDASHVDTLKGLLDSVVVPLQGVVNSAADYLGIAGGGAKTGK